MRDSTAFEYNEKETIICCFCSNQIPIASIYCPMCGALLANEELDVSNTEDMTEEERQQFEMKELDKRISSERESLSVSREYQNFYDHCEQQKINIDLCKKYGWDIPALNYNDPISLMEKVRAEIKEKEKKKKTWTVGIVTVLIIISISFGFYKSREGKVQVPFDSAQIVGESIDKTYKKLNEAGFENITKEQDASGWLEDEKVTRVSIDDENTYAEGAYRNPNAEIVIHYSSKGRTEVSNLLKNWTKTEYENIEKKLKDAGFTNVEVGEEATFEVEKNKLVSGLSLNGKEYIKGKCYLPISAPISITFYKLKIAIGTKSSKFKKKNYVGIVDTLKDLGFTNIQLYRTDDLKIGLMTKEGSVKSISIDGNSRFKEEDSFFYDVPIVIVVNTFEGKGCDDITDVKY